MDSFYELPVNFRDFFEKNKPAKCDLHSSVHQHIEIILVTRFGEYRFDPTFGCSVWDYDFEVLPKINAWKNEIEHSLATQLERLEPRLNNVIVKVNISVTPLRNPENKIIRVQRKINIAIKGRLVPTNEIFERSDYEIFFSPISED